MKNIKAVIFDLNGVFIQGQKLTERFHRDFGIDENISLPALYEVMSQMRRPGASSAYSYWLSYFEKWGITFSEKEFLHYWFSGEKENREMVLIGEHLRQKGITLFILSNNLRERTAYYNEQFPFLKTLFKKVYYSWETGFVKPDKRAFELVLRENNLQPEECLYFDDSAKNVEMAEATGIESYLFQGSTDVKEKLSGLLDY